MINSNRPERWKNDVAKSVHLYNTWFLDAAPKAYRDARERVRSEVKDDLNCTGHMKGIEPSAIKNNPAIVSTLRMSTSPTLAQDRLVGLAEVPKSLVSSLEEGKLPKRMKSVDLDDNLEKIATVVTNLLDLDLFDWVATGGSPSEQQWELATVVVSDRKCGMIANPIIRNAQETRQLGLVEEWLMPRGYTKRQHPASEPIQDMQPGTFSFRQNITVGDGSDVNMPIDIVIQPHNPTVTRMPTLIEAKSAGDFTNTNKRRKEEATKIRQLKNRYGAETRLILFLCGYFDASYLGYEAAEGLDWVWEHRIDDLEQAGV